MKLIEKLTLFLATTLIFGVISFVFFHIPSDHVVSGGDFYQHLDYRETLSRYQYAWMQQIGQGGYNPLFVAYPFYFVMAVVNTFFPMNFTSSWIIFIFLLTAFWSFYFAIGQLLPKLTQDKKTFTSFLYATNSVVISIFTYPWGYTHHFLIYLFLPLLISSYVNLLIREKGEKRNLLLFVLAFVLSLPAYNNVALFVLLLLIQGIVTLGLLLLKIIPISLATFRKLFLVFVTYLVLATAFFYPMVYNTLQSSNKIFHSQEALGGEDYLAGWIESTSSHFLNTLTLALDDYRYPFFQTGATPFYLLIGTFYVLLLAYLIYQNLSNLKQNDKNAKLTTVFLMGFIVMSVLSVRFYAPVKPFLQVLYLSPLFLFFRSPEKIQSTLPLFYCLSIAFLLAKIEFKKLKFVYMVIVGLLLFPLTLGVIQHFLVNDYNQFDKKIEPEYTYVVSVPQEYKDIQASVNSTTRSTAVVSLPYSVKNSISWSNYPKWQFIGHDILHLLFNKRYISANTFDHPGYENQLSFKQINDLSENPSDVLVAIKKFGGEFVIFHKDIDPYLLAKSKNLGTLLESLVESNALSRISENEYFILYQLSPEHIQPVISVTDGELWFQQLNPTMYRMRLRGSGATQLQFLQSFDPAWRLFSIDSTLDSGCETNTYSDGTVECQSDSIFLPKEVSQVISRTPIAEHSLCLDYANCWEIASSEEDRDFILYYVHQNVVYGELALVLLVVPTSLLCLVWLRRSND